MTDVSPQMPQPGEMIGPYKLLSVAGRGGMGVVYRAADTLLHDRAVAVKVMASHLSSEEAYRAAFLHEAHVASEVTHPHLVPVHAAGEADGRLYLAMAWVDGQDLGEAAADGISVGRAADAIQQIARALQALHDAGIVHGDVKPGNVILHQAGDEDHAYLVDFGVARRTEFADPRTNELVGGTPAYAAPETAAGPPAPASDQYELGCVLYELLTGDKPFGNDDAAVVARRHATAPRPLVSDSAPELAYLDEPVSRAMAVDPAHRYPDAATFGRALAAAQRRASAADTVVTPVRPGPAQRDDEDQDRARTVVTPARATGPAAGARAPSSRRGWLAVAALVALLLVVGALVAILSTSGGSDDHTAASTAQTGTASTVRLTAAARKHADEGAVARLVTRYAQALGHGNVTLLKQVVAANIVRRGSDGIHGTCVEDDGRSAAVARWSDQMPGISSYRVTGAAPKQVEIHGDQATVLAHYVIGDQPPARIRFTAHRTAGNDWRLTRVVVPPCKVA